MGPSPWREGVEMELTKWPGAPSSPLQGHPSPPPPRAGVPGTTSALPGRPAGRGAAARPPLRGPCVVADTKGQCQC